MMACEEAWLLGKLIRSIDPQAILVMGPVPATAEDEVFKNSFNGKVTFTIKAEKVPNAAGIRRVIEMLGGPTTKWEDFVKGATPELKKLKGGWIVGGYLSAWVTKEAPPQFKKGFKVVQDILPSTITDSADVLLPSASWAEKGGCWENYAGKIQAFDAAIAPPNDSMREGDVYYKLLGRSGFYNADDVRGEMGEPFATVKLPAEHAPEPAFEFVEL